jgi:hypothetical protein
MIDAFVLTQGLFADLREGIVVGEKAKDEIKRMWRLSAKEDGDGLFAGLPDSYSRSDEYKALSMLFKNALKRLK